MAQLAEDDWGLAQRRSEPSAVAQQQQTAPSLVGDRPPESAGASAHGPCPAMAHVLEWATAKLEKVDAAAKVVLKEGQQGELRCYACLRTMRTSLRQPGALMQLLFVTNLARSIILRQNSLRYILSTRRVMRACLPVSRTRGAAKLE